MVGHRTMVGLRKKSEARILATREIKRQKTSGRTKFRFNNMFFFFAPCISRENGKKLKNSLERNGAKVVEFLDKHVNVVVVASASSLEATAAPNYRNERNTRTSTMVQQAQGKPLTSTAAYLSASNRTTSSVVKHARSLGVQIETVETIAKWTGLEFRMHKGCRRRLNYEPNMKLGSNVIVGSSTSTTKLLMMKGEKERRNKVLSTDDHININSRHQKADSIRRPSVVNEPELPCMPKKCRRKLIYEPNMELRLNVIDESSISTTKLLMMKGEKERRNNVLSTDDRLIKSRHQSRDSIRCPLVKELEHPCIKLLDGNNNTYFDKNLPWPNFGIVHCPHGITYNEEVTAPSSDDVELRLIQTSSTTLAEPQSICKAPRSFDDVVPKPEPNVQSEHKNLKEKEKSKSGYCERCKVKFDCLKQHLNSVDHRSFDEHRLLFKEIDDKINSCKLHHYQFLEKYGVSCFNEKDGYQ